jgi:hypothetical protein
VAFDVVPMAASHIDGFRATLDAVARERRYLYFLEAPALEDAKKFVRNGIAKRHPHFVALEDGKVIVGATSCLSTRGRFVRTRAR